MRTIKRFAQCSPCDWTSDQAIASDESDEMFDISSMIDSYISSLSCKFLLLLSSIWLAFCLLGVLDLHKLHLIVGIDICISFWKLWPFRTVSLDLWFDIDFEQYSIQFEVCTKRYEGNALIGSGNGSGKWNCFGIHICLGMRYPKCEFVR